MSIIYDALKKVQGEIKIKNTPPSDSKEKPKSEKKPPIKINPLLLYFLLIILGFFSAGIIYRFLIPSLKTESKSMLLVEKAEPVKAKSIKQDAMAKVTPSPKPTSPSAQALTQVNTPAPETPKSAQEIKLNTTLEQGKQPVIEEEPPPTLTLNGIFFAGKNGYALINNQIVREGDQVGGLLIKKIKTDTVELGGNNSRTTILTNPR